jgi:hypothetical protein
MKRRYWYLLLFGISAAICAAIATVLVVGAVAGAMWIFVYGDNPWPATTETTLATLAGLAFVAAFLGLLSIAYRVGRAQEERAAFDPAHLRLALGSAALLLLVAAGYEWKVGNVGPRSDGALKAAGR